jgi:hypothetical protein
MGKQATRSKSPTTHTEQGLERADAADQQGHAGAVIANGDAQVAPAGVVEQFAEPEIERRIVGGVGFEADASAARVEHYPQVEVGRVTRGRDVAEAARREGVPPGEALAVAEEHAPLADDGVASDGD